MEKRKNGKKERKEERENMGEQYGRTIREKNKGGK